MEVVHLMLGGSSAGLIASLFSEELGQRILPLEENYSVGPLLHVDTPDGVARRCQWVKVLLECINAESAFEDVKRSLGLPILRQLDHGNDSFVVWVGPNADEQIMLRAVLSKITRRPVKVVDVGQMWTEAFEPRAVAECSPGFLRHALARATPLSEAEGRKLRQDWVDLTSQSGTLRVYSGGKITTLSEDHFDEAILLVVSGDYGSAARVVGRVLGESPHVIGDAFISYRLRKLISAGAIEALNADADLRSLQIRQRFGTT